MLSPPGRQAASLNRHAPDPQYSGVILTTGPAPGRHRETNSSAHNTIARDRAASRERHKRRNNGRIPRGVKLSNLPPDLTKVQLNTLLTKETGPLEPSSIRFQRTSHTASAQAVFKSSRHAKDAVQNLDQRTLRGRRIRIAYDEEYEFKSSGSDDSGYSEHEDIRHTRQRGPMVVDGAQGSRHKRSSSSEDEESGTDSDHEGECSRMLGVPGHH